MHVPQARNEVAACRVDHVRTVGYPDLVGRANGYDALARDKNGVIRTERSIHYIHDNDISDCHGRGIRLRAGTQEQAEDG